MAENIQYKRWRDNVSYEVRRESRVVDCLVDGTLSNQTCCAVSSSLLTHVL
jgi:hypothetical protein